MLVVHAIRESKSFNVTFLVDAIIANGILIITDFFLVEGRAKMDKWFTVVVRKEEEEEKVMQEEQGVNKIAPFIDFITGIIN